MCHGRLARESGLERKRLAGNAIRESWARLLYAWMATVTVVLAPDLNQAAISCLDNSVKP